MKHFKKYLLLFVLAATVFSCKKNVIEYDADKVTEDAEFQLNYFVPLSSDKVNIIYKVEINGEQYANSTSPLSTYNAIPSGAVGRFYTTKVGQNNIKLYKSTDLELVYDQNVELTKGKQNIFVYDFNKPPIVFDSGYPFNSVVIDSTAKVAWVRFYNFLFETEGVPTALTLQYQRQHNLDNETKEKSAWINIGEPVAFGEATDWVQVDVIKEVRLSSSTQRADYRIRVIGADGSDQGSLEVMDADDDFGDFSDWWNASVGRRYQHVISGMRAAKPTSGLRQFTAL